MMEHRCSCGECPLCKVRARVKELELVVKNLAWERDDYKSRLVTLAAETKKIINKE